MDAAIWQKRHSYRPLFHTSIYSLILVGFGLLVLQDDCRVATSHIDDKKQCAL